MCVKTAAMEIKAQRVVGVGFGNIFAPGQISLRPHAPKPAPDAGQQQTVHEPVKPSQVSEHTQLVRPTSFSLIRRP